MLVVSRFRVAEPEGEEFGRELDRVLALLAERPGFEDGRRGRNVDDPTLWVLVTRWADVGSYRRALSTYDVKVGAVPLLSRALDEPSAFETPGADGSGEALNRNIPR